MGTSTNSSAVKSAAITPTFVAHFRDIDPHIAQMFASATIISLDFPNADELVEEP